MMRERLKFWWRVRKAPHWTCPHCCLFCRWFRQCRDNFECQFAWWS